MMAPENLDESRNEHERLQEAVKLNESLSIAISCPPRKRSADDNTSFRKAESENVSIVRKFTVCISDDMKLARI